MKRSISTILVFAVALLAAAYGVSQSQAPEPQLKAALEKYEQAFRTKDAEAVKQLLASDILLYEHSVRNDGLQDAFENHLKPEIVGFEEIKLEYIDERITPSRDVALVTRQYKIQGKLSGREINASGNETLVWKKVGGEWKVAHIHYSHACPRPAAAR